MDERTTTAARRLWRRAEDSATNGYKVQHQALMLDPPDMDTYVTSQKEQMAKLQEALDEFEAATTGKCPCGRDVKYPKPEELADGKAVSRYCDCGRSFVIG